MEIGKLFVIIGGILLVIGLVYTLVPNLSFPPKLPGDIFIKRGNFTFYFPIVTSILLSIILTIIINFFLRK
jgi:hypothetical protein